MENSIENMHGDVRVKRVNQKSYKRRRQLSLKGCALTQQQILKNLNSWKYMVDNSKN